MNNSIDWSRVTQPGMLLFCVTGFDMNTESVGSMQSWTNHIMKKKPKHLDLNFRNLIFEYFCINQVTLQDWLWLLRRKNAFS